LDRWNHLKAEGHEILRAIILAAQNRLRPILITTSCTVLGLMPLALSNNTSSNLWSPLALTVIGGLLSSTLLTLFVIPMMVAVIRDLQTFFKPRKN
jgi:HAE1 family hydrophobic/amphiphilic exporter-1